MTCFLRAVILTLCLFLGTSAASAQTHPPLKITYWNSSGDPDTIVTAHDETAPIYFKVPHDQQDAFSIQFVDGSILGTHLRSIELLLDGVQYDHNDPQILWDTKKAPADACLRSVTCHVNIWEFRKKSNKSPSLERDAHLYFRFSYHGDAQQAQGQLVRFENYALGYFSFFSTTAFYALPTNEKGFNDNFFDNAKALNVGLGLELVRATAYTGWSTMKTVGLGLGFALIPEIKYRERTGSDGSIGGTGVAFAGLSFEGVSLGYGRSIVPSGQRTQYLFIGTQLFEGISGKPGNNPP